MLAIFELTQGSKPIVSLLHELIRCEPDQFFESLRELLANAAAGVGNVCMSATQGFWDDITFCRKIS